jgi:hypothetical protein
METKIYVYKGPVTIKPEQTVKSFRRLTSFCFFNLLRDCIIKAQGGYYVVHPCGAMEFFTRCLDDITFQQVYDKLIIFKTK